MGWSGGVAVGRGSYTVYVNIGLMMNKLAYEERKKFNHEKYVPKWESKSPDIYKIPDSQTDGFISTLIHEMRHCLQFQLNDARINDTPLTRCKIPPIVHRMFDACFIINFSFSHLSVYQK